MLSLLAVCSMSCSNHSTERVKFTDLDKSIQDLKTNSTDEDSCLLPKVRLSEFAKYQSFDEFSYLLHHTIRLKYMYINMANG